MKVTFQFLLAICLGVISFGLMQGTAQDNASRVVDIYWNEATTLQIPGLTNVVVLDDSISRAEISNQKVQFFGLQRGETIAFAWIGDERITLRLRIAARPVKPVRNSDAASRAVLESPGHGMVGSAVQMAVGPKGDVNSFFTHRVDWQQLKDGYGLAVHGQFQDGTTSGLPGFNMNSITLSYETPRTRLSLMDFPLEINGGVEAKVSLYSAYNVYPVRGATFAQKRGANTYEFFGGTTIPSYFRTLTGTRDVAGFNFTRKESAALSLYSTLGWVNSPTSGDLSSLQRRNTGFETAGLVYRPSARWAFQGAAGASTRGLLAQGSRFVFRDACDDVLVRNSIIGRLPAESVTTRLFRRFIRQYRNNASSQPAHFDFCVLAVHPEWCIRLFACRGVNGLLQLEYQHRTDRAAIDHVQSYIQPGCSRHNRVGIGPNEQSKSGSQLSHLIARSNLEYRATGRGIA